MIIRDGRVDIPYDSGYLFDSILPMTDYVRKPGADTVGIGTEGASRTSLFGRVPSLDTVGFDPHTIRCGMTFGRLSADTAAAVDQAVTDGTYTFWPTDTVATADDASTEKT